jgi:hypothetical protein
LRLAVDDAQEHPARLVRRAAALFPVAQYAEPRPHRLDVDLGRIMNPRANSLN